MFATSAVRRTARVCQKAFSLDPQMMPNSHSRPARWASTLDICGAASAAMCAAHCVATGMFVSVLPLLGARALVNESIEQGFIAAALILGVISIGLGLRAHRQRTPALLLIAGLATLLAVRPRFDEGTLVEVLIVIAGAALLVAAHWRNQRAERVVRGGDAVCNVGTQASVRPSPAAD